MDEQERDLRRDPPERVERHEVVERTSADRPANRAATPMWVWVLPLLVVVVFLVWYILTAGEPSSPLGSGPVEVPTPTTTDVDIRVNEQPTAPEVEISGPDVNVDVVTPPEADPAPGPGGDGGQ